MGWPGAARSRSEHLAHLLVMETNAIQSGLEPLLTIEALAEYLDVPVPTIRDWRTDGKGPCGIRVGGRVRFAVSDVHRWLDEQRETEPGHAPNAG